MNYALVENGTVTNLIWLHPENASDFANAVAVGEVPVEIGDTYAEGLFCRDGEPLVPYDNATTAEMADMRTALNLLGVNADE